MTFEHFPYTNFHNLNLDWMIGKFNEMIDWANALTAEWEETKTTYQQIETGFAQIQSQWSALKTEFEQFSSDVSEEWETKKNTINAEWSVIKTGIESATAAQVEEAVETFQAQYDSLLEQFDSKFQEFVDDFLSTYILQSQGNSEYRTMSQNIITESLGDIAKLVLCLQDSKIQGFLKADGSVDTTDTDHYVSPLIHVKWGDIFKFKLRSTANTGAVAMCYSDYGTTARPEDSQKVIATGAWQESTIFSNAEGYIRFGWNADDDLIVYAYDFSRIPAVIAHATGQTGTVTSVNAVDPDDSGNVQLAASNILTGTQLNAVNSGITSSKVFEIDGKYTLPLDGIPFEDLDEDVQDMLLTAGRALTEGATYRGTYATPELINREEIIGISRQGDFAFITGTDSNGNSLLTWWYLRGNQFQPAFTLYQNSFSATQWAAINSGATASIISTISEKYVKPDSGIPVSHLSSAVQSAIEKADNSVQKSAAAIPSDVGNIAVNASNGTLSYSNVKLSELARTSQLPSASNKLPITSVSGYTSETWTFTLDDDSTVSKKVVLLP